MSSERKPGVVVIPMIRFDPGVGEVELLTIDSQEENGAKLGELCPLVPGAEMKSLVDKPEFPGGKQEDSQSVLETAISEFVSETGVHPDVDFKDRLKFIFEDFPIDQLRPELTHLRPKLTHFAVKVALLELTQNEVCSLERQGAERVLVSLADGVVKNKTSGRQVELRPAHEAIIRYLAAIANSFVSTSARGERVEAYG